MNQNVSNDPTIVARAQELYREHKESTSLPLLGWNWLSTDVRAYWIVRAEDEAHPSYKSTIKD